MVYDLRSEKSYAAEPVMEKDTNSRMRNILAEFDEQMNMLQKTISLLGSALSPVMGDPITVPMPGNMESDVVAPNGDSEYVRILEDGISRTRFIRNSIEGILNRLQV